MRTGLKKSSMLAAAVSVFAISCNSSDKKADSEVKDTDGYGLSADVGIGLPLLGANAMLAVTSGDRIGLVAVAGMEIAEMGAGLSAVKIHWDTKSGNETVAGSYCSEVGFTSTFLFEKNQKIVYTKLGDPDANGDHLTMTVISNGIGLKIKGASCIMVLSLGLPNSEKNNKEKVIEAYKQEMIKWPKSIKPTE